MIPLLAMSVISLTLILERAWFWLSISSARQANRLSRLGSALRRGERAAASKIAADDTSPHGRVAAALLEYGVNESVALEAVERQRPRIERFMVALSTIVTAAPLLGIPGDGFRHHSVVQPVGRAKHADRPADGLCRDCRSPADDRAGADCGPCHPVSVHGLPKERRSHHGPAGIADCSRPTR